MTAASSSRPSERTVVSVALATFNGAAYLRQQLTSLATQSRTPDQVVIRDDGSTDATIAICDSFARRAPFDVSITSNPSNVGFTSNFANALANCSGDYVFLCDQDDVWHERKIEEMVAALESHPKVFLAVHDVRYCDASLNPTGQTKLGHIRSSGGSADDHVTGMATVARRDFLEVALPIPDEEIYWHDSWLHDCASALGGRMVVPTVLADYRRHDANTSQGDLSATSDPVARKQRAKRAVRPVSAEHLALTEARFTCLMDWLQKNKHTVADAGLASIAHVDAQILRFEGWAAFAKARAALLDAPLPSRLFAIWSLWREGGYRPFKGTMSALKDVVLPWR